MSAQSRPESHEDPADATRPAEPALDDTTLAGRGAWWSAWSAEQQRIVASSPPGMSRTERGKRLARLTQVPPPPCYTCGASPDGLDLEGNPRFEHAHDEIVQMAVRVFGDDLVVPRPER